MKLGIVVNVMDSDEAGATTYRLAADAISTGHQVWVMSTGNFAYNPDDTIGAFARTGPNVAILGGARLGPLSLAGAGAIIHEDTAVGANSIVGANSVVLSAVGDDCRVYGAPARPSGSAVERMNAGSPSE